MDTSPAAEPAIDPAALRPRPRRKPWLTIVVLGVLLVILFVVKSVHQDATTGTGPHGSALSVGLGTVVGALLAIQLQTLITLLLGRLGGTAANAVFLGSGPLLARLRIRGVPVAVRLVPLPLPLVAGAMVARVPALRLRLWLSNASITAVQCGAGAVLLFDGSGMGFTQAVGLGLLLLGSLMAVLSARATGSRAWILWRMPFERDGRGLREVCFEPAAVAASRALLAGRLDEADTRVSELVDQDCVPALSLRAAVALGLGEYRKAALLAVRGLGQSNSPAQRAVLAGIHSRAAAYELEAGTLAPEAARPAMEYAFGVIRAEFPQLLRFGDLASTVALLDGRAHEALRLARKSTKRYTDVQTTAFALCTLAAAQAVTGDQRGAAATLDRARVAMPLLARIAVIEQRIMELTSQPPH
ncbi:hypothetical protein ACEZDB_12110 [Streptacidiphilus sp. N1-3]|uniref:Uncharacterized protein n=1 Tax=Streptacidiphilus alkalitolerans TaxID=3342712 RepID=A0ABV6WZC9_9ACTN